MRRIAWQLAAALGLLIPSSGHAWELGSVFMIRDYQIVGTGNNLSEGIGINLSHPISKKGEIEFQGLLSKDDTGLRRTEYDKNVLILWNNFLFLTDWPVAVKKEERYRLWEASFRYWHQVTPGGEEFAKLSLGSGLVANILEKQTKTFIAYQGVNANTLILNPRYKDEEQNETFLTVGIPLGMRLKIPIYNDNRTFANLSFTGEYLLFANAGKQIKSIHGQAIDKFGGLRLGAGFHVVF